MKVNEKKPETIDAYISVFPEHTQKLLQQMRTTIKKAAPKAEEVISYGMPAFKLHSVLVYFAGYKNHIGFYPTPSGIKLFSDECADYKTSKGAVQFPLDKPLPVKLIKEITLFRVKEDKTNAAIKAAKKNTPKKKTVSSKKKL
ncbi:iron chaperone [Cytophaga hutchinsonii]|uniref:YdhG-like domain-containing protein n=1 Tax=Cytophaga hutchinsonii (strain ATCC 33406 / DSM 1761 / CIP 103989 / NBRC 15051 / NCIMB 9469 / D465) TaxID=269798 RepID=A0A6N4SQU7_CYTH3|nr:DUF1801 domain-containing protein [Cytophaga hutchinsonii]ABG58697.1 conserved hypothetical protein [Cytophaga hutchinsonii ATCC 33406]SFX59807.1 Uncharacterized conserved protein YdhG, YjbR/CyaY-like superfamily, DUF1801 family [Cytophaga hutchinsonii ATCC 33406]